MGGHKYIFDKENFKFRREHRTLGGFLGSILKFCAITLSLTVIYYIIISLFISTDTDKKLRSENKMYEKFYDELAQKEKLLGDVVKGLSYKDNEIYKSIFNTEAPAYDRFETADLETALIDSITDISLLSLSEQKTESLRKKTVKVEANFKEIANILSTNANEINFKSLPLSLPVKDMTHAQIGASLGKKINPFYKVMAYHDGLDIISSKGDPVIAAGDGIVTNIIHSRQGKGNVVEITHVDGYVTKYAHLSDIKVIKGRKVRVGQQIGSVGMSGRSFAPHLHYEVLKDGVNMDPINYFFADIPADEYFRMVYMAVNTGQSMD